MIALALALAGCAVDADLAAAPSDPAALATEQAPPPGAGGLTLEVDGILEPGTQVSFRVTGTSPNASVYLVRGVGEAPGALCPAVLQGLCVDVSSPRLLTTVQANAQGIATFRATIPNLPDGTKAFIQAAEGGATAATSNVVARYNPASTAAAPTGLGSVNFTLLELAQVTQAAGYQGARLEQYNSTLYTDVDACSIASDAVGTNLGAYPPCAGCTFAFSSTVSNYSDASRFGDCQRILGVDVTTLQPFAYAIGYQANYTVPGYGPLNVAMGYSPANQAWTWISEARFSPANGQFVWGGQFPNTYTY
jgi:hypothetical protein